jgi:type 1 fimbria pilin
MKKLLMGIGALGLMVSTASADPDAPIEATINVDGERECVCELRGFGTGNLLDVNFGEMGNRGQAQAQNLTGLGLFCNTPFDISLASQAGYLKLNVNGATQYDASDADAMSDFESDGASGFAAGLDYSAEVFMGGSTTGLIGNTSQILGGSANAVGIGSVPPQNVSNVRLRFDTIPGSLPLIAGDYSDVLTINITPQAL